MGTSWKENTVAEKFNLYNDVLENALGFQYLMKEIKNSGAKKVLDYGCGPGKVSLRLAQANENIHITAVDESEEMINIAQKCRGHKSIDYHLISNDSISFIKDNSVDFAIICFVFINNGNKERILAILKEIYRVLKKGGTLIILDSNPDATGMQFSTFRNGDAGKIYHDGDCKKQYLHIEEMEDLVLEDYYWSKEFYLSNLSSVGFSEVSIIELNIKDLTDEEREGYEELYHIKKWGDENNVAPFIIFKTNK